MIEDNARTPIGISESENINLKMESYTIIGDADAIYNQGFQAGEEKGFEQGYTDGHADGYDKGYAEGYSDGFDERKYEIWTMTLADGSTVHKEIALL